VSVIQVRVQIIAPPINQHEVGVEVDSTLTLTQLLELLVREFGVNPRAVWTFELNGEEIDPGWTLRELVGRSGSPPPLQLVLRAKSAPGESEPPGAGAPPFALPTRAAPPARCSTTRAEVDHDYRVRTRASAPVSAVKGKMKRSARKYKEAERSSTERVATVRYYSRMNPDRMFPLLVILSARQIEEVVKKSVKQAVSEAFEVEEGSCVEIEPVLPGCDCYPPRHVLAIEDKDAITETFWVVPRVIGRVHGARVLIRQGDRVLADVPLDVKVSKQTLAVACGLLSLAAPYMTMGLKSLKLDYESQKADGFPLYQQAGAWIAENLRPEWLGLGLLGLAFLLYLWMRPRRRDVFWDVSIKS
jgi:hypothetical protein